MKFAVIETGGKQYKVSEGDVVKIEKLSDYKEGGKVTFDKVLLIDDGKTTEVGSPYIKGAKISAVFESEGRNKKIHIIKFKSKSNYKKKIGHRQPFNKIKVEKM
ncbi:50S ribosomal protein L21 [Candidatus Campbellbacteria bacterium RIFCSPLOWO2_02_FULL_35_11]|uniref:Large ribosomal subunit protein bL21 n=2 Tax=Candidatus Campbelliibacteriota TaxID=1752727 RepID=A0A1F5ESC5_9BACT|nr:MAG: 50S ribosomal protein L21 [Candidatus Campbellbacteria bacterium RIFCSPLOWO2_02_FULL_35_11]